MPANHAAAAAGAMAPQHISARQNFSAYPVRVVWPGASLVYDNVQEHFGRFSGVGRRADCFFRYRV
jgi:hypothetical protein